MYRPLTVLPITLVIGCLPPPVSPPSDHPTRVEVIEALDETLRQAKQHCDDSIATLDVSPIETSGAESSTHSDETWLQHQLDAIHAQLAIHDGDADDVARELDDVRATLATLASESWVEAQIDAMFSFRAIEVDSPQASALNIGVQPPWDAYSMEIDGVHIMWGEAWSRGSWRQDFVLSASCSSNNGSVLTQRMQPNGDRALSVTQVDRDGFAIDRQGDISGDQQFMWVMICS